MTKSNILIINFSQFNENDLEKNFKTITTVEITCEDFNDFANLKKILPQKLEKIEFSGFYCPLNIDLDQLPRTNFLSLKPRIDNVNLKGEDFGLKVMGFAELCRIHIAPLPFNILEIHHGSSTSPIPKFFDDIDSFSKVESKCDKLKKTGTVTFKVRHLTSIPEETKFLKKEKMSLFR